MEPSGVCISVAANKPTVLGRGGVVDNTETAIDLSEFGAYQCGVSRRHCQLRRRGMQLLLTDLGSANGTYLNDQALVPHRDQVVAHGDRVTLSRLRLTVLFSVLD
jgi:pSer/pThr/pTyr-binding forkhead associated (FHA) protein